MKQTATDWIFDQLWETPKDKLAWFKILMEAKEMEKKQIMNSYEQGIKDDDGYGGYISNSEQYYKETYQ